MGITYTTSGDGASLWNFPDTEPSSLTPNDFTVTAATPTSLTAAAQGDGFSLEVIATGQFSNGDSVVGQPFGDVTQTLVGSIAVEVTTVTIGDAQYIDRLTYDPPTTVQPTTSFFQTLGELQIEWAGDDVFIGDRTNAQRDSIFGYGGNDRFVMTYSDSNPEQFRGGDGIDTAILESASEHWEISSVDQMFNELTEQNDLSGYEVTDTRFVDTDDYGQNGHTLQISEVERLEFTDKKVALDFEQGENSFKAAALITSMFGSDLIPTYFAPAVDLVDQGSSVAQIAQLVIDLGLVDASSNQQFFSSIYENVVGVEADPLTQALYVSQLDSGELSQAGLVAIGANASIIESQMSELATWRESGLDYLGF